MVIRALSSAPSNNFNAIAEPITTPASNKPDEASSRSGAGRNVRSNGSNTSSSSDWTTAVQARISEILKETVAKLRKDGTSLKIPEGLQAVDKALEDKGFNAKVKLASDSAVSRDRATASRNQNVANLPASSQGATHPKSKSAMPAINIEIHPESPALQDIQFKLSKLRDLQALVNSDASRPENTEKTDDKSEVKPTTTTKDNETDVPRYILRPTTSGNPYVENPKWREQQERKKAEASGASATSATQGLTEKNNEVRSNIGAYGTIAERTPRDLPQLDSARPRAKQVASIDKNGNVTGFDKGETFRLPSQKDMDGKYLTLFHDINDKSSLVINAGIQTKKQDGPNAHQIRSANIGMGDDLAIILDGHGEAGMLSTPTFSYNGQPAQKMEIGKTYISNDGAKVRYLVENGVGKLQISSAEQVVHFEQQPGDNYLTLQAQLQKKADAHALGLIGIMAAEGQQFVHKSQASIEDYAQRHAAISDRFGAALPNHSQEQKGMHETGDEFASVDREKKDNRTSTPGYYLREFYASLGQVSAT